MGCSREGGGRGVKRVVVNIHVGMVVVTYRVDKSEDV